MSDPRLIKCRIEFGVELVERSFVPQHPIDQRRSLVVTHLIRQPRPSIGFAESPSVNQSSNRGLRRHLHRPHLVEREGGPVFRSKERYGGKDRLAFGLVEPSYDLNADGAMGYCVQ